MALVVCKDCGKEISSAAKSCLNCGCPNEIYKKRVNKRQTKLLFVKLLLLAIVITVAIFLINAGMLEWIGTAIGNVFSDILLDNIVN